MRSRRSSATASTLVADSCALVVVLEASGVSRILAITTSDPATLNGDVTINGNLSQGMGEGGGSTTMLGPVAVTNDVTAGGKSLQQHTHREHDGPETGPAQ